KANLSGSDRLRRGEIVPSIGFDVVLLASETVPVHIGKQRLCLAVSRRRRSCHPAYGLVEIFIDGNSIREQQFQRLPRGRAVVLSRHPEPLLGSVGASLAAVEIDAPELVLRLGVSDSARAPKPGDRIGYAARNPAAPEIKQADPIIGFHAAKDAGPLPCLKGLQRPALPEVCQSA